MAAFKGLYDFDVIPYAGDLTKYGQGPGHQWFDFYGDPEEGGEEETEEEGAIDHGTEQQQQGGPDGGRGQAGNSHPTDLRSFDSISDFLNDPDVQKNGRALMDMVMGVANPAIQAMSGNGMFAGKVGPVMDGSLDVDHGFDFSPAETYSGGDWSGPANDPNAGDGEQGGLGGNRDGGFANGGPVRASALPPPRFIRGPGDGRSDSVPAFANGGMKQAHLSNGEFVWPADTVSAIGRGSSEAGAQRLGQAAQAIRQQHMARMSALPPPGR